MSGLTIAHAKSDTCDPVIRRCGTAMGTKIGRNEMEIPPLDQTMFSRPRPRFGDATVHADAVLTVLQMPTWQHAVSHARSAREFPGRLDQTMIFQAATKVWECGCTRRHHPRAYALGTGHRKTRIIAGCPAPLPSDAGGMIETMQGIIAVLGPLAVCTAHDR